MQTINAFFSSIFHFFAVENTVVEREKQIQTIESEVETRKYLSTNIEGGFFEELPPMEYYLLSAHFFMP